jgi:hypothetical protein
MTIKTYPFNPMPSLKPLEMPEKSYFPEHFDAQHAVSPAFTSPSDRVVIFFMRYEIWIVHVRLLAIFLSRQQSWYQSRQPFTTTTIPLSP